MNLNALAASGTLKMIIFALRTAMLFAGVVIVWRSLAVLWEKRPVIFKKRYVTITPAKVIEITEERHSASQNTYYLVRFEYEENGERKVFAPPSYRPCRLKVGDEVTLLVGKKGRFRTVRKKLSVPLALIKLAAGAVLIILQLI